jgi:hypothetical protein
MSSNSVAHTLRLQKVRETSISSTAILEKKHRRVYDLAPVRPMSKGAHRAKQESPPRSPPGRAQTPQDADLGASLAIPVPAGPAADDAMYNQSADPNDVGFGTAPLSEIVWTQRSNTPGRSSRPVSRDILQPELAKYHAKLSRRRISELNDRIVDKVNAVSNKVTDKYQNLQASMDSKSVFHPHANAQRAHSLALTKLHKILKPELIETVVLAEMISDDKRNLTSTEIEKLEHRFGRMLKGTAFGTALKAPVVEDAEQDDDALVKMSSPEGKAATLESRSEVSVGSKPPSAADAGGGKSIRELKDRKILDFDEFRASQSRATTPGSPAKGGRDRFTEDEGFKEFQSMRTQQHRADTRRQPDKEPLTYNKLGVYSGLLKNSNGGENPLIGTDVHSKLWHDSERHGKKASYKERHSDITGFKNDFLQNRLEVRESGAQDGDVMFGGRISPTSSGEGDYEEYAVDKLVGEIDGADGGTSAGSSGSPERKSPRKTARATLLRKKKKRRASNKEEGGSAVKDALQLQARIEATWVILEMPMIKKLQFLQKYSDAKYSMLLPRAVELFEKAAVAVPLRETVVKRLNQLRATNRMGLQDLEIELDMDGKLMDIGCMMELPESFYFEKKVEQGGLDDAELLLVEETFEERVSGAELVYAKDLKVWLEAVLDKLDMFCLDLMADLEREIDEKILWKGLVYAIKRQKKFVASPVDGDISKNT